MHGLSAYIRSKVYLFGGDLSKMSNSPSDRFWVSEERAHYGHFADYGDTWYG